MPESMARMSIDLPLFKKNHAMEEGLDLGGKLKALFLYFWNHVEKV